MALLTTSIPRDAYEREPSWRVRDGGEPLTPDLYFTVGLGAL